MRLWKIGSRPIEEEPLAFSKSHSAMRLLFGGSDGKIGFKDIAKEEISPYAILSHRRVEGEPTYQDVKQGTAQNEKVYQKLVFCQ